MTKILVIEDEDAVRKPLEDHLDKEGYKVIVAQTGKEGDRRLCENPDLIIIDWMLPDIQGIELLRDWRSKGVQTPAIMLTARTELIDKVIGLELGANDYMTKPFEPRELIARIRAQLRSRSSAPCKFDEVTVGEIKLSVNSREVHFKNIVVELTKTEFELLKLFVESPNQVFSREEILQRVWGYENYPTTRTVDTHVLQLRQKFRPDFFETVHGIGYRFREKV